MNCDVQELISDINTQIEISHKKGGPLKIKDIETKLKIINEQCLIENHKELMIDTLFIKLFYAKIELLYNTVEIQEQKQDKILEHMLKIEGGLKNQFKFAEKIFENKKKPENLIPFWKNYQKEFKILKKEENPENIQNPYLLQIYQNSIKLLILIQFYLENFNDCIHMALKQLKTSPKCLFFSKILGQSYQELDKFEKALQSFEKSKTIFDEIHKNQEKNYEYKDIEWIYLGISNNQEYLKQYDNAEKTYKQFIDMYPAMSEPYINLAEFYSARKNFESSREYFLKAEEANKNDNRIYISQGFCFWEDQALYEKALDSLQKALDIVDFSEENQKNLAQIHLYQSQVSFVMNKFKHAEYFLKKCFEAEPKKQIKMQAKFQEILYELHKKNYKKGIKMIEKIEQQYEDSSFIHMSLGGIYLKLYDEYNPDQYYLNKAEYNFQKGNKLKQNDADILVKLGEIYTQPYLDKQQKAINYLEKAIKIEPQGLQHYEILAKIYAENGMNQCISVLDEALKHCDNKIYVTFLKAVHQQELVQFGEIFQPVQVEQLQNQLQKYLKEVVQFQIDKSHEDYLLVCRAYFMLKEYSKAFECFKEIPSKDCFVYKNIIMCIENLPKLTKDEKKKLIVQYGRECLLQNDEQLENDNNILDLEEIGQVLYGYKQYKLSILAFSKLDLQSQKNLLKIYNKSKGQGILNVAQKLKKIQEKYKFDKEKRLPSQILEIKNSQLWKRLLRKDINMEIMEFLL